MIYFNPPTPSGVGRCLRNFRLLPGQAYFNPPTPSGVGRCTNQTGCKSFYFNPPTPSGVGRYIWGESGSVWTISIHPPRAGWDTPKACQRRLSNHISIHPPRAGWDAERESCVGRISHFNPPTPSGVGLGDSMRLMQNAHISIHPPRAGWDASVSILKGVLAAFQSTHPERGGTSTPDSSCWGLLLFQSTHPERGGT